MKCTKMQLKKLLKKMQILLLQKKKVLVKIMLLKISKLVKKKRKIFQKVKILTNQNPKVLAEKFQTKKVVWGSKMKLLY